MANAEDQSPAAVLSIARSAGEGLPEHADGRAGEGDRVGRRSAKSTWTGSAVLPAMAMVWSHGVAGGVHAHGDGAAEGDAVDADEGDGAAGARRRTSWWSRHLDEADRGVAEQHAGGQRVDAAVRENAGPRPMKIRRPWPASVPAAGAAGPAEDSEPWMRHEAADVEGRRR